jgi:hypothetical protein
VPQLEEKEMKEVEGWRIPSAAILLRLAPYLLTRAAQGYVRRGTREDGRIYL